ncbi:hypothetical protein EDB86DRAFT_2830870 [Lactarius hatsudake]|nr:hypothetical protein EDB86DRAFT_2830870 [Lactarius hatsudake]
MPFKLPKLEVTPPEEYMTPFARKHYENLHGHLWHQTQAGGQDTLTILVNARLTIQEHGQVKPTIITINHENLQQLLFNVLLPHWLKKYKNYPLSIDNIKIKNGTKQAVTGLYLMLILDRDHVEAAKAHQDADPDSESVHCIECSSVPTLLVSHTEASSDSDSYAMQPQIGSCPRPHPKPHPLYGKKWKISELLSSEDMPITPNSVGQQASGSQSLGDQTCTQTQTSHTSHMIPDAENIRQALITQCEPSKIAIDGLHNYWYGAFKSMQEGQIKLPGLGPHETLSTLASAPQQKEVYFIKKLIQSDHDGPWRKYINNNSSCQCNFKDTENYHCPEFLACCQHVQYWRMCGLVFTSDFQEVPSGHWWGLSLGWLATCQWWLAAAVIDVNIQVYSTKVVVMAMVGDKKLTWYQPVGYNIAIPPPATQQHSSDDASDDTMTMTMEQCLSTMTMG